MANRITQEVFAERVSTLSNGRFKLISEYRGRDQIIKLHCNIHNIEFDANGEWFGHGKEIRGNCPLCAKDAKKKKFEETFAEVRCAYCGKLFYKERRKLNSKSGKYFCCKEHKNLAQSKNAGSEFDDIRPDFYKDCTVAGKGKHRQFAFQHYEPKCAVCGYDEDASLLEVHHIDENHSNNALNNLMILCPLCHKKLTTHNYKLVGRTKIVRLQPMT